MTTSETRGYVVGLNKNDQFTIPNKLMQKIVTNTGNTALLIWLPNERALKIQPIESDGVIKLTIWFHALTQTSFENINSIFKEFDDILIYKTGVLFPYHFDEKPSIEYYFKDGLSSVDRIKKLEKVLQEIDEISSIEIMVLKKYIGD